jgi:TRAP-type mannitol/chloroaromatic compound transport system permease small subunit
MPETEPSSQSSILDSLRSVLHNGVDYLMSSIGLLQARMTGVALSAVVFIFVFLICLLFVLASFILMTIAFGMWLAKVTGNPIWSLIILGFIYLLMAGIVAKIASKSLHKLNS